MWFKIKPSEVQLRSKAIDLNYWTGALDKYPIVRKKLPRKADKVIGADLFNALFQWEPVIKENPDDPAISAWLNKELDSPAMNTLRRETMGSRNLSAFGAIKLYQELNRPRDSAMKTIADTKNNLDTIKAMVGEVNQAQAASDAIQQAQTKIGEAIQDGSIQSTMQQAVKNTIEDIQSIQAVGSIMNQDYDLNSNHDRILELGLDEQLMATLKNQAAFRRILESAGRLRLLAGKIKSAKPKQAQTPIGITQGRDLDRLVPQELALLDDSDLEDLFYKRWLEADLLQYDLKQRIEEGRGPIIFCLDVSGSMEGLRAEQAKAMFLQLTRIAVDQRRKICLIPFATTAGSPTVVEEPRDLISIITDTRYARLGGGTDFNSPLDEAVQIINVERSFKDADIIFATDGQSYVADSTKDRVLRAKKLLGFRILGVNFQGQWESDMKQLLDVSIMANTSNQLSWSEELLTNVL